MAPFDFVVVLLSFVYAAAITHILATAGDIIIRLPRIRASWVHAGWMLLILFRVMVAWFSLWNMRHAASWSVGVIAFFFALACAVYLQARLVAPRIPAEGALDLRAFHRNEGRKYLIAWIAFGLVAIATNVIAGGGVPGRGGQLPMLAAVAGTLLAIPAALFIDRPRIQGVVVAAELVLWIGYFTQLPAAVAG